MIHIFEFKFDTLTDCCNFVNNITNKILHYKYFCIDYFEDLDEDRRSNKDSTEEHYIVRIQYDSYRTDKDTIAIAIIDSSFMFENIVTSYIDLNVFRRIK